MAKTKEKAIPTENTTAAALSVEQLPNKANGNFGGLIVRNLPVKNGAADFIITVPKMIFKGKKYTADDLIAEPLVLAEIAQINSAFVKPYFEKF
jgi:hypothetical protein